MSWLSSLLTAPGTNAAQGDQKRKQAPQDVAYHALPTVEQLLQSQLSFQHLLEPIRQSAIQGLVDLNSPLGQSQASDLNRTKLVGAATDQSNIQRQRLARGGFGIGAQQGADVGTFNAANRSANDFQSYLASPQGRTSLMQILAGASNVPSADLLSNLSGVIYGRPAPQVGPSPLASIAGIAGQLATGGTGGLFGGGTSVPAPGTGSNPWSNPIPNPFGGGGYLGGDYGGSGSGGGGWHYSGNG